MEVPKTKSHRKRGSALVVAMLVLAVAAYVCRDELIYAKNLYRVEGGWAVLEWLKDHELNGSKLPYSWQKTTPESKGMDSGKLDQLRDDLARYNTRGFLVLRENKIVYEWYSADGGPEKPLPMAALGKAVTGGMALLVALEDGRLHLDDPVSNYVVEWRRDPRKSKITIGQLAKHTSGIDDVRLSDEVVGWKETYRRDRRARFELALSKAPLLFEPDTRYGYSGMGYYVLAYALTLSLRHAPQRNIKSILTERLMDPLGIPRTAWHISYGESYEFRGLRLYAMGSGGSYSPRAIARLGQFMLNRGRWNDRRIVSPSLIDAMLTLNEKPPAWTVGAKEPTPALGWWVNTNGFWPSLPRDACIGAGMGHQVLLVVPSLDLVAVRMGGALGKPRVWGEEFWVPLGERFLLPLMQTFKDAPPADRPPADHSPEGTSPLSSRVSSSHPES